MKTKPTIFSVLVMTVLFSTFAVEAGVLVVRTESDILAFDTASGAEVSRYGIPTEIDAIHGMEWDADLPGYLLSDDRALGGELWTVDGVFASAQSQFDLPDVTPRGIAYVGNLLYLNGQSTVPPDTLYALDGMTGEVQTRFPMPEEVENLRDLTYDGTHLWGVELSSQRLWRIEPSTGAFELMPDEMPGVGFAIAWDPAGSLWYIESIPAKRAHAIDPADGTLTGAAVDITPAYVFGYTAVFRNTVTPILPRSWGGIKARFRED